MSDDYANFLASKAPRAQMSGFEPGPMHEAMRPDQKDVTAFAIRAGRCLLALDTGNGKTFDELEWCRQTAEASNGLALLLTPLAVARQIEREGHRWGYDARVIRSQDEARSGINICNYDRLDLLEPLAFGAVALDESDILKNMSGSTSRALINAFSNHRFRLCATATPAPNDHMELGQHAEFLGQMSSQEMLSRWFINDTSTASQKWRIKGHAANSFWDWMATWSRCAESPRDLGYDVPGFVLPELKVIRHKVAGDVRKPIGALFSEDVNASNIFSIKRQTANARAEALAELVALEPKEPWVIWCDTDAEADAINSAIPDSIEVRGSHAPHIKEDRLSGFSEGKFRILVSKPGICGRGMNWQHCARTAYIGRSFSYQAWYQSVRRFWRYGQTRPVHVHLMVAEGEDQIGRVIDRKAADHAVMKSAMSAAMARARIETSGPKVAYNPTYIARLPSWLVSAA